MRRNNTTVHAGVGFSGLLAVAFIVLKLLGRIDWPWLWVLAPVWGDVLISILLLVILAVFRS